MHVMLLVCICACETGWGRLEYVEFVCKTADCCAVPSACYRRHSCTPRDTPVLGQRPMLPHHPKAETSQTLSAATSQLPQEHHYGEDPKGQEAESLRMLSLPREFTQYLQY